MDFMGKGGSRDRRQCLAQTEMMIVDEDIAVETELSDSRVFWRRGSRNGQWIGG